MSVDSILWITTGSSMNADSKVGISTWRATDCNSNLYLLVKKVHDEVLLFAYNSSKSLKYIVAVWFW